MQAYAPPTNKPQPGIAYAKAVALIGKHAVRDSGGVISYAECRRVLSWLYHLNREEVFVFLGELESRGLCIVIPYRGIRLPPENSKEARP